MDSERLVITHLYQRIMAAVEDRDIKISLAKEKVRAFFILFLLICISLIDLWSLQLKKFQKKKAGGTSESISESGALHSSSVASFHHEHSDASKSHPSQFPQNSAQLVYPSYSAEAVSEPSSLPEYYSVTAVDQTMSRSGISGTSTPFHHENLRFSNGNGYHSRKMSQSSLDGDEYSKFRRTIEELVSLTEFK